MTRRIVQIETVIYERAASEALYALCEDGSVHYGWWDKGIFEWRNTVPPVDIPQGEPAVDPIAEIEAMACWIAVKSDGIEGEVLWLVTPNNESERVGFTASIVSLRAAAARLLERVRGEK